MRRKRKFEPTLSEKANRILNGTLVVLFLILFRLWYVSVVQHEEKLEASRRPQRRTVVEGAQRATIRDRFGTPLAYNTIQYNAAVSYDDIREIPRCVSVRDESGRRIKKWRRKEHITALSSLLGEELHLDPERIEDLIHSKASIFGGVPFVLKENIDEKTFLRLKMLEKDWPGIRAEAEARRVYPHGALAGEAIGYMGMISTAEYEAIATEMRTLRDVLSETDPLLPSGYVTREDVEARLKELEGKSYSINDYVGKAGVEGAFDAELRGARGKRLYLSDIRGNFLHELDGSEEPKAGTCLNLTLSSELQLYAEQLLVEYEQSLTSATPAALKRKALIPENQPWIKGGAIVAFDPKSGEVLALASYPRFDPNDFIRSGDSEDNRRKSERIGRWLESEAYLASIWDGKCCLERERFDPLTATFFEDRLQLSWENYLSLILPACSPVRLQLNAFGTIKHAIFLQDTVAELLKIFSTDELSLSAAKVVDFLYHEDDVVQGVVTTLHEKEFLLERCQAAWSEIESLKEKLTPYFDPLPLNYEKILLVDLMRLVVDSRRFTPGLATLFGEFSLEEFREATTHLVCVKDAACALVADLFQESDFRRWREKEFKGYLAQKRKEEERAKKKYGRPYIEYLDEAKSALFETFWNDHQWELLAFFLSDADGSGPYCEALANWRNELLAGAHAALPWVSHYKGLKHLTDTLDETVLIPFLHTLRGFDELDRPLLGNYRGMRRDDSGQGEKHLAMAFYPLYGYGYARSQAFRQATTLGSIFKVIPAYEAMRQKYIAGKEHQERLVDLNPLTIKDDKHRTWGKGGGWNVGFTMEGKVIPMFYRGGRLPRSEHASVGVVDVKRALETSSNPYFALLAGDVLEDPEDLILAASLFGFGEKTGIELPGEIAGHLPTDVAYNRTGLYALSIGQHTLVATPLQTAVMLAAFVNGGKILRPKISLDANEPEVQWAVLMPEEIRDPILAGMRQVVMGEKGTARSLRNLFPQSIYNQLVGKTSTAEAIERFSLDGTSGQLKSKHIWFGAVSFDSAELKRPELVVVVYLRHGDFGWRAAPLAARIVQKWREILANH